MIMDHVHVVLHCLGQYVDGAFGSFKKDRSTNSPKITDDTFDFCIGNLWFHVGFCSTKNIISHHRDDACEIIVLFHE